MKLLDIRTFSSNKSAAKRKFLPTDKGIILETSHLKLGIQHISKQNHPCEKQFINRNLKLNQLSCPGLKTEASLELTLLCYKLRLSAKLLTVPYDTVQSHASKPVNKVTSHLYSKNGAQSTQLKMACYNSTAAHLPLPLSQHCALSEK